MLEVITIINESTDWIENPISITNPIHLISKYSHKEQNVSDNAKPVARINVVIIK